MRGSECVEEGDGGAGEEPGQQQLAGQTGAPGDGGDGDGAKAISMPVPKQIVLLVSSL